MRTFLARIPPELKVEKAIVFGSRARGDNRPDSDADLALVFERGNEWPMVELLGGLSFDVLMDTGILIQPVPISTFDWAHPERFPRPGCNRSLRKRRQPLTCLRSKKLPARWGTTLYGTSQRAWKRGAVRQCRIGSNIESNRSRRPALPLRSGRRRAVEIRIASQIASAISLMTRMRLSASR